MARRRALAAALATLGLASAAPAGAAMQAGDPSARGAQDGTLSAPTAPQTFPTSPPVQPAEPAADAARYALRSGPQCSDFQAAPGASWRAAASVRFPGPQGEVRLTAGQVVSPGAYVSGLDLTAILQARCF